MSDLQERQLEIYQSFTFAVTTRLSEVIAEAEERALQQSLNEADRVALVLREISKFYNSGIQEISTVYINQTLEIYPNGNTNQLLIGRYVESTSKLSVNLVQAIDDGLHIGYQVSDEIARSGLYRGLAKGGSKVIPYIGLIVEAAQGDAAGVASEGAGIAVGGIASALAYNLLIGAGVVATSAAWAAFAAGTIVSIPLVYNLSAEDSDFRAGVDDYIEDFFDFVTLTIDPYQYQNITIKNYELNNGELAFPNGLQILHFVHRLDPSFDLDSVFSITEQSSSAVNQGPEDLLHAFEKLFIGTSAKQPVLDAEDYFRRIVSLREEISNDTTGRFDPAGNFQLVTDDIFEQALLDTQEGRAARYALQELNPFIYTSQQESFYDYAAPNGELDLANYTEQYLQDRAQYLSNLLQYNLIDADVDYETIVPNIQDLAFYSDPQTTSLVTFTSDSGEPIVIDETLKTSLGDDDAYRHFIFDNDEDNDQLNGKDQNDHIYGAGGNDTLDGGKGNDYLEGGTGHDTYQFNYGDGRDRIVDNGAADEKNKLFITHTDGGTASQVSRLALLAGSSVYQEVDAAGDVINPATTYALISNAAGQDSLLITVDGGKGGSITHQFDNGFAQWSSAFLCMSKETNQRKHIPQSSPLGALVFDKNKRSALCHIPVAKRLKSTSCCLNPLFVSTLDLMKGKQAA